MVHDWTSTERSAIADSSTGTEAIKLLLVHGTWGRGFDPDKPAGKQRWFEEGSAFWNKVAHGLEYLGTRLTMDAFLWSGANSISERGAAAIELAHDLDGAVQAEPDAHLVVIAHSHGGNVALAAIGHMTQDRSRVQLITLATPFLTIRRRTTELADRLFAVSLFIGLLFASVPVLGALFSVPAPTMVWLAAAASILTAGGITFDRYGMPRLGGSPDDDPTAPRFTTARLLFRCLLVSVGAAMLTALPTLLYLGLGLWVGTAVLFLPFFLVAMLLFAALRSLFLSAATSHTEQKLWIPPLTIVRSRGDEASLALGLGRLAAFLGQVAGTFAICVPALFAGLGLLVAFGIAFFLLARHDAIEACIQGLPTCRINGDLYLSFAMVLGGYAKQIAGFIAGGLALCLTFTVLTGVCKAGFGRELVLRALNVTVAVHDTPDGSDRWPVLWCRPGQALRHSIYDNPDGVDAVIGQIRALARTGEPAGFSRPVEIALRAPRRSRRSAAVTIAFVAATYVVSLLLIRAPVGAHGLRCALMSYTERSSETNIAVLVPPIDQDDGTVRAKIEGTLAHSFGIPLVATCVDVPTSDAAAPDAKSLGRERGARLALWGRVVGEKIVLKAVRTDRLAPDLPISRVVPVEQAELAAAQMVRGLLQEDLAGGDVVRTSKDHRIVAWQLDRLAQENDLPPPRAVDDGYMSRIYEDIYGHLYAADAMMRVAERDRDRKAIRRSVAHFDRATALQKAVDPEMVLWQFHQDEPQAAALALDAKLNRNIRSARKATSLYSALYKQNFDEPNVLPPRLMQLAQDGAAAFAQLDVLRPDPIARQAKLGLACQSLVWLHEWDSAEFGRFHEARLPGTYDPAPQRSKTEAYAIMRREGVEIEQAAAEPRGRAMAYCSSLAPDVSASILPRQEMER